VFTDVDLAIDRGSRVVVLGLNGAGKTTLLRILAGVDRSDTGAVTPGHGLKLGYYAQEHETLDTSRSVLANMKSAAPNLNDTDVRKVLGSFLFSGDDVDKPAAVLLGQFSGCEADGEGTSLSLAEVFLDYFADAPYPVVYNFPAGHVRDNATLPLGVRAKVDANHRQVSVLENAVTAK